MRLSKVSKYLELSWKCGNLEFYIRVYWLCDNPYSYIYSINIHNEKYYQRKLFTFGWCCVIACISYSEQALLLMLIPLVPTSDPQTQQICSAPALILLSISCFLVAILKVPAKVPRFLTLIIALLQSFFKNYVVNIV